MEFMPMTHSQVKAETVRDRFLCALEEESVASVKQSVRAILEESSGVRNWAFITRAFRRASQRTLSLKPFKVALLSSFSTEFFHAPLTAYGLANGLDIAIYQAGLDQVRQEILNPASHLYGFGADIAIVAVEGEDWFHGLYREYVTHFENGLDARVSSVKKEIRELLVTFRRHSDSALMIHNFSPPVRAQFGIIDTRIGNGQIARVLQFNEWLAEQCREIPNVYVLDYAALVGRIGALRWYDERMSNVARAPIAMDMLQHLMNEYMKFFRALTGQNKKCLVLDLDNTLWGGTLGEEGTDGIQLGPVYPGSAFLSFQQSILQLKKKGILLAVASKNNADDVDRVFETNPYMVLRKEHFVCFQVHWKSKVESLREISRHTNIGLDHIVFVDDDPVECEAVSRNIPDVHVIRLPARPEMFVDVLMRDGLFDAINYSAEDSRRAEFYRQRQQAEVVRSEASSVKEFYRNLQMKVTFSAVDAKRLQRAAQLTQKTNQFNATTRRYTETGLLRLTDDPKWLVIAVRVEDRFGDNGFVGLMLGQLKEGLLDIDTFLLSCRVIGRTIETAMLAYLCQEARQRGLQEIAGRIVNSAKNTPVRDVFERHGFQKVSTGSAEESSWRLHLNCDSVRCPDWLEVKFENRM
jgi:FkbH-like protein